METTRLQKVFAENLKRFRSIRGYSQTVLAEKSGISLNFLSQIEIAKKFPSPENIELLALALEVKTAYLFIDFQESNLFDDPILSRAVSMELRDRIVKSVRQVTEDFLRDTPEKTPLGS